MLIRKYLHSCLLIEDKGKKLLIDPGTFSFAEGKIKPSDIGPVDAIVITHNHHDHYSLEAVRVIARMRSPVILAGEEIGGLLEGESLNYQPISGGEVIKVAGFTIRSFEASHGPLPAVLPNNLGFLVNETILHPGDSYNVHDAGRLEVLALPVAGPWARLVDSLEFAQRLKPKTIIPIHDAMLKDFALERVYALCQQNLERHSIVFHPLSLGEMLEV